jgi:hypothetical protein
MDTSDYIIEAERQLSDQNFYIAQETDLSDIHRGKTEDILYNMWTNDEIDMKTLSFLRPTKEKTRTSKFYFLPKIHKRDVKGRPIISGNGCPTENISAFVDEHIKGYLKDLPSYLKDERLHPQNRRHKIEKQNNLSYNGCILTLNKHP